MGEVTTHTDMTKSQPSVPPKEDKRPEERVADTDSSSESDEDVVLQIPDRRITRSQAKLVDAPQQEAGVDKDSGLTQVSDPQLATSSQAEQPENSTRHEPREVQESEVSDAQPPTVADNATADDLQDTSRESRSTSQNNDIPRAVRRSTRERRRPAWQRSGQYVLYGQQVPSEKFLLMTQLLNQIDKL